MSTPDLTPAEMIAAAQRLCYPRALGFGHSAGSVACALLSAGGHLYYGVCIDVSSGIGFCAEHAAIAAMVTAGETAIAKIVAVGEGGRVLPPCGRCREFMAQVDESNLAHTEVILGEHWVVCLADLLPHPYVGV
ncbi:cytidine deaminase family protein [Thermanaerothrix daxensis]|nr:cytidine deaminase [Thermanaerothrix daxensis]